MSKVFGLWKPAEPQIQVMAQQLTRVMTQKEKKKRKRKRKERRR
jgi:hypothetical protein